MALRTAAEVQSPPGPAPCPAPLGRLRDGLARPLVLGVAERLLRPAIGELRTSVGAPVVLVTTSSELQDDGVLVRTALEALARGVPVCVVPFGRDQLEVARRVEVSGAGVRLPAKRLDPQRLRAAVRTAMTRTDGARRVAEGYAATGGPAAGAAEMERRFGLTSASPHDPARP